MKPNPALKEFESRVREVIGPGDHQLHVPRVEKVPKSRLLKAIDSSLVSVDLELVSEVEQKLCDITGSKFCVATSSGTSALHLALLCLGVSRGDYVVCTSVSFVATANAILYCGAQPIFLDIDPDDLALSSSNLRDFLLSNLEESSAKIPLEKIKAVVVTSVFGLAPDLEALASAAHEAGLPLLIDAAGALGTEINGKSVASYGEVGVVSFNGNKIVTSGGGGAIVTANPQIANKARHLSLVSKKSNPYEYSHDGIGFNYRMPALNAALLFDQLSYFDEILRQKKLLHCRYASAFEGTQFNLFEARKGSTSNYWLNSILITDENLEASEVCSFLVESGIGVRKLWTPLPRLPHLKDFYKPGKLNVAELSHAKVISLPSSYWLAD